MKLLSTILILIFLIGCGQKDRVVREAIVVRDTVYDTVYYNTLTDKVYAMIGYIHKSDNESGFTVGWITASFDYFPDEKECIKQVANYNKWKNKEVSIVSVSRFQTKEDYDKFTPAK